MPDKTRPNLDHVAQTLLIPLYTRYLESQRPDALVKDEKAVEIVNRMDCDFSRLRMRGLTEPSTILRIREIDRHVREFAARHSDAVIVHIGCGLDTRFERVDNGRMEWFDLDLPEVIELRRELVGGEQAHYHFISRSVFDTEWFAEMEPYRQRPILFLAEGVFPYFEEQQVKELFLSLRDHFSGCELVCDALTPFLLWFDNFQLSFTKIKARLRWGLKHGKDVEKWGAGLVLLEEWFYFDHPEPRLNAYRWLGFMPFFQRSAGIFHYRLGSRGEAAN